MSACLLLCVFLQVPSSSNSSYSRRQMYQGSLLPFESCEQGRLWQEAVGSIPFEQDQILGYEASCMR
jgi:hypothetical protein